MNLLLVIFVWCILFVLSPPIALLALVALALWPLVWLLALPFRLIGILVFAVFAFLKAILLLPAWLLGWRPRPKACVNN